MAAKDVKDRESLERWLSGRPIEDARVVAAKAALISVPSLDTATRRLANADWLPPLLANAFRGPAVALLAANRSNLTAELAKASRDAYDAARATAKSAFSVASAAVKATESNRAAESQDFARGAYADASDAIAHAATDAVSVSSCAAYSAAAGMASSDAARAASGAVNSAVNSASEAGSVWDCVRTLAETFEKRIPRRVIAYAPLWPEATPEWIMERWQVLKRELLARSDEHWDVWTDWYEARLRGEPGNEDEEIARILEVTEEEWAAGPAVANKKIKDIVARFRSKPATTSATATNAATAARTITAPLFISHASQADGARAHALAAALEAAGQPCWIAPRDIAAGADWNGSILAAIEACGGVVLLVSPASVASPFVKAEIQHAFEHKKRVVPVRLAEAQPSLLDLRLKTVQHIEADGDFSLVVRAIVPVG